MKKLNEAFGSSAAIAAPDSKPITTIELAIVSSLFFDIANPLSVDSAIDDDTRGCEPTTTKNTQRSPALTRYPLALQSCSEDATFAMAREVDDDLLLFDANNLS